MWVVGNATQTAQYFQSVYGMELVAYSGPETGNRDHHAFVLRSGAARFVHQGRVSTRAARLLDHHRMHGDGIVDIALAGARRRPVHRARARTGRDGSSSEPHDISDEHGTVRLAAIATYGDTRHTLVDRSRYTGPYLPGYVARTPAFVPRPRAAEAACSRPRPRGRQRRTRRGWTSGSTSTTASWASPTWRSSSATTSPPSTRR